MTEQLSDEDVDHRRNFHFRRSTHSRRSSPRQDQCGAGENQLHGQAPLRHRRGAAAARRKLNDPRQVLAASAPAAAADAPKRHHGEGRSRDAAVAGWVGQGHSPALRMPER